MKRTHGAMMWTERGRSRHGALGRLAVVAALVLALATPVAGQELDDADGAAPLLVADSAALRGSGPWTAWFGGSPDRELSLTIVNAGPDRSPPTEVSLRPTRGADVAAVLLVPAIDSGDTVTLTTPVDLPRFALGTYAVEGDAADAPALRFRTETSHVPWVLVFLPLAVVIQLALLFIRNRVRRRLQTEAPETEPAAEPDQGDDDPPPELEDVVAAEIAAVFDPALDSVVIDLTDGEAASLVIDLADAVGDRVLDRHPLAAGDEDALRAEITSVMLDHFALGPGS